jgi:predicted ATP-grasp superfamily ATP-dependent carboligase
LKILVLDGNENQAVACVRALSKAGHEVFVGAGTSWPKAAWSRYCKGSFVYTSPQKNAEAFVENIVEEVQRTDARLVLPMTERSTLPLSANREDIISAGAQMILPPHETVLRAFDKRATTDLAASLGITIPQTYLIKNKSEAEKVLENISYPVVLKPWSSEELSDTGKVVSTGRPLYAISKGQFLKNYTEISRRCSFVLAQEFIDGRGAGYFALMQHGELRAEFAHRRIRDVHPTGSGSALRESVFPEPLIRDPALLILKELKWHGVAMVEFRVRPDGQPVFLEVNGRFWNSLPLAVYAGADFPKFLAEMSQHGDVKSSVKYKAGVRCRWLLGDFRHLIEVWKGAPLGYPGKFPHRLESLLSIITPGRGTMHDNFTFHDPPPEIADWFDFFVRKLPSIVNTHMKKKNEFPVKNRYSTS